MSDILEHWKVIAAYMGKTEKTVRLYWKKRGLPVVKNAAGHPAITKQAVDAWRLKEHPTA